MDVLVRSHSDDDSFSHVIFEERDRLMQTDDDAPRCPGLRKILSNRIVMLFEASSFGVSLVASTLPWFFGSRVCDTSQFKFGSPLSVASLVMMPVSFLCYVGSSYSGLPEKMPLDSDDDSELTPRSKPDAVDDEFSRHGSGYRSRQSYLTSDGDELFFRQNTCDEADLWLGGDEYLGKDGRGYKTVVAIHDEYTPKKNKGNKLKNQVLKGGTNAPVSRNESTVGANSIILFTSETSTSSTTSKLASTSDSDTDSKKI